MASSATVRLVGSLGNQALIRTGAFRYVARGPGCSCACQLGLKADTWHQLNGLVGVELCTSTPAASDPRPTHVEVVQPLDLEVEHLEVALPPRSC